MKKLHDNQVSGPKKKNKKGAAPVPSATESIKLTRGLIYVNEQYDGSKAECLRILQSKFNIETRSFTPDTDKEILDSLQKISMAQNKNFKQTQKECMPFIRFKKDEAIAIGSGALDLKQPFGEIEVLKENLDLIRRQLGLEEVEILSFSDPDALNKAGTLVTVINQNPPSPGSPSAIFMSRS